MHDLTMEEIISLWDENNITRSEFICKSLRIIKSKEDCRTLQDKMPNEDLRVEFKRALLDIELDADFHFFSNNGRDRLSQEAIDAIQAYRDEWYLVGVSL